MRFMDLGAPELILIVVALVLVFGAGKLGDIGGALGKSVREFKRAQQDEDGPATEATAAEAPIETAVVTTPPPPPPVQAAITDYRPGAQDRAPVR